MSSNQLKTISASFSDTMDFTSNKGILIETKLLKNINKGIYNINKGINFDA